MSLLTADELLWLSRLNLGKIVSVQPLVCALTNHVFLLTDDKAQQIVFKRLNLNARDRQARARELAVQKLASERGLSPEVLGECEHYRAQSYIKGKVLDSSAVDHHFIELLAAQLQIIHQLPAKHAQPQRLAGELLLLKKQLNKQRNKAVAEKRFQHFLQLATELDKSSPKDTLCHGDLSFNNLVQAESGQIKILDWEYAVLACPAYDLASCCAINGFTSAQQIQLINHYYRLHTEPLPLSLAQLQKECALYRSVFACLNQLWQLCFQSESE